MTLQILLRVWRRQVIDNIFIFRESEKSLKETPLGLFSWWRVLRARKESEKHSELWYWFFDSMIKVSKWTLEEFFHFQKYEKVKNELPNRLYCLLIVSARLKWSLVFPKYLEKWLSQTIKKGISIKMNFINIKNPKNRL